MTWPTGSCSRCSTRACSITRSPDERRRTEVSTPQHQQVATQVAEAGTVLLKNDSGALPLSRHVHSIALIGPTGNDAVFVTGGSAGVPLAAGQAITPAQGIAARAAQAGVSVNDRAGLGRRRGLPDARRRRGPDAGRPAPVRGCSGSTGATATSAGPPSADRGRPDRRPRPAPPITPAPPAWSARWTGTLTPTESGLYRFTLSRGRHRDAEDRRADVRPRLPRGDPVHRRPELRREGNGPAPAGQRVPVEIDYSSRQRSVQPRDPLRVADRRRSRGIPAAVTAARNADVAIVFANDAQGEGMDRYSLSLAGDQNQLIDAVAHANRHTIVVLNTGGAVLMPWLNEVSGVLEAWYPGQQFGPAIAAVLFGDASPGGRLPVTFPASENQGPAAAAQPNTYPGDANGERELRRGPRRRLPLVRRHRPAAPVPVRLRTVVRELRGLRRPRVLRRSPRRRVRARAGHQYLAPSRAGHRRAVPAVATGRAGAAQAAQGLHERDPRPRPDQARPVPPERDRPGLLQRRGGQVHGRAGPLHGAARHLIDRTSTTGPASTSAGSDTGDEAASTSASSSREWMSSFW